MIVISEDVLTFRIEDGELIIDAPTDGMEYYVSEEEAISIAHMILVKLGKDKTECN